jgi:amino acid adenylation domain-containing protein
VPPALNRIEDAVLGHCREAPERTAVRGDADLNYAELDALSGAAAARIADLAGPGARVAVRMRRSERLVAALLAVLRAGATYVPLDPAHPADRIRYILDDTAPALLITDEEHRDDDVPSIRYDDLVAAGPVGGRAAGPPDSPSASAYIVYTSGTTGRPKGVEIAHGSVRALIDATRDELALEPGAVWSWYHSVAFDFSVWEIWGALMTGGTVAVVPEAIRHDLQATAVFLREREVSVLSMTPTAFGALAEVAAGGPEPEPSLVVFGGEPLSPASLKGWSARHRGCRLVNMYGITETTVHVTARDIDAEAIAANTPSVGRPLRGWKVRVVDADLADVPVERDGEILVGGAGLAIGYVGRPELTAERFITGPGAERWYRSGDRGRLRPDGELEHLGRIDRQVQLRGHRIEPAEIEAVLAGHPEVRKAVVAARESVPGEPTSMRLDAFVETAADEASLIAHLARFVPDYMIPAQIVRVESWPLTANGKLDLDRLAANAGAPGDDEYGSPAEALVAKLWTELLGSRPGPDDVFFDCGGNSLTAAALTARLRSEGHGVSVAQLYRNPTVRALAALTADSPKESDL